ncbi:MAG: TAXI family TRAP transporter solute-binding subunit [Alphaproteobacteria bacterium]|nr:TAXI family TRAP transporter solute-binding subunit [Alphaproteobacteria bacterium]
MRAIAALGLFALVAASADAQQLRYFRIGTGEPSSSAFAVGSALATVLSSPPGAPSCAQGGSCGVPGLVVVASSSAGAVANVEAVSNGTLDSAFAQADIVNWAHQGIELFRGKAKLENLRAIANLYPEYVHLVVRKGSSVRTVGDLKDQRVAVDVAGSGTLVMAGAILRAFGLNERTTTQLQIGIGPAVDQLASGEIDATFYVGAPGAPVFQRLAERIAFDLVPIEGRAAMQRLRRTDRFFTETVIPAGSYEGVGATKTLGVGALWIVSAAADPELIHAVTRALWHPTNRRVLTSKPGPATAIALETALSGIGIPLHPGALRYYQEIGLDVGG